MLGAWEQGLDAIQSRGIRVIEIDGAQSRAHPAVFRDAAGLHDVGIALILVKSWQTGRAASDLARCLTDDGLAVTLQNGLGNLEILQGVLGQERAALGVTTTGATLVEPGVVRHGGDGPISLGSHEQINSLAEMLTEAGFDVQRQEDLRGLIWSKLAVNAAINPLSALLEVRNGQLLEQESARELMQLAAEEVARLAGVMKIQLSANDPVAFAYEVARRTAENASSMLQDILRGAPTEIDAICGAVVKLAIEHGIELPVNRCLWKLVGAKAKLKMER